MCVYIQDLYNCIKSKDDVILIYIIALLVLIKFMFLLWRCQEMELEEKRLQKEVELLLRQQEQLGNDPMQTDAMRVDQLSEQMQDIQAKLLMALVIIH